MGDSLLHRAMEMRQREGTVELYLAGINKISSSRVGKHPIFNFVTGLQYLVEPDRPFVDRTKLYGNQFWYDRFLELKRFYNRPKRKFLNFYFRNGLPNTDYFQQNASELNQEYFGKPGSSPSPDDMLNGYRAIHFYAANRLMLGYHQYNLGSQFLDLIDRESAERLSVLDYGCGVSDPGILLGLEGADITIVDLDTKLLDFAEWRLRQRGIEYIAQRAHQTEEPVQLQPDTYDFVIMSEFLEHTRNPTPFLRAAIQALKPGGVLYDPVGRQYTHTVTEQHLAEARDVVESEDYKRIHREHFRSMEKNNFWQKI